MAWQERVGILVMLAVVASAGLIALAVGHQNEAGAISNCSIAPRALGVDFLLEEATFDDLSDDVISQAEQFVCHEMKHPRDTRVWKLHGIDAFRRQVRENYSWQINLRYTLGIYATPSARYLVLEIESAEKQNPLNADRDDAYVERISVRGQAAELVRYARDSSGVLIRWRQNGLAFAARVIPETGVPDFNLRDLIAFLGSID